MEARLKAILEMESSQMQKELVAASNNLKKFERELAKATDTNHITYLQRSINIINADINRLTASANGAAKATNAVGGAMKSSQMNSMNFARVIQDLPFGFMGIQNNLTQLIPGIGAAGIAFSALTAAITFSQVGLSYWSKGAKDAKASISDLSEFTKEFTKNAAEEGVKARLLYEASNNVAISMDKRIRAAKELKDMYPDILKNYSAEDIALGKASKGYQDLTNSILSNARAKAAQNKITELEAERLAALENINKIEKTVAYQKKRTTNDEFKVVGMAASDAGKTAAEKNLELENNKTRQLNKQYDIIKKIEASQRFMAALGGGATAMQESVIPEPTKEKIAKSAKGKTKKAFDFKSFDQRMRGGFQESLFAAPEVFEKKQKTEQQPQKGGIGDPKYWEMLAKAKEQHAMQLQEFAEIAEYGGQVFGQMVNAMIQGENVGEVIANAFKQIAVQIAAAVAQALIFAALLEAFPALKGVFATTGALAGNGGGGGGLLGKIQGQDIQISQRRTSTGMGFRRGRR